MKHPFSNQIDQAVLDDPDMEQLDPVYDQAIRTLRYGFLLAAALFVTGLVWTLLAGDSIEEKVEPIADIPGNLIDLHPKAVLDLSFLTLMFTPVATVMMVAISFFRVGDRRYGTLSLVVLLILAISISLSLLR